MNCNKPSRPHVRSRRVAFHSPSLCIFVWRKVKTVQLLLHTITLHSDCLAGLDSEKIIICIVCKMFLVRSSEGGCNGAGYVLHMGRLVMQTKFRSGNLKGRESVGDVEVYGRTALKLILNCV